MVIKVENLSQIVSDFRSENKAADQTKNSKMHILLPSLVLAVSTMVAATPIYAIGNVDVRLPPIEVRSHRSPLKTNYALDDASNKERRDTSSRISHDHTLFHRAYSPLKTIQINEDMARVLSLTPLTR